MTHKLAWFKTRINKQVYTSGGCKCPVCKQGMGDSLIIKNEIHANMLWSSQFLKTPILFTDRPRKERL